MQNRKLLIVFSEHDKNIVLVILFTNWFNGMTRK